MPSTSNPSSRFRRAALAERDRLLRQRDKAEAQASGLRERLEEAEDRLHRLDERIGALQELVGESGVRPVPAVNGSGENGDGALKGARIRELAVRTLLESGRAGSPIHYRAWLDLLEQAGYKVAGKRPDAVFLNQVVRSPVIKATTTAGVYELDPEAPERLERKLARLQTDLRNATAHNALAGEDLEKLTLEIRRVQRTLHEATNALERRNDASEKAAA